MLAGGGGASILVMLTDTTIEVVRSGGLAGLVRRASLTADELDEAGRDRLEALLDRVPALPAEAEQPPQGADRYQYDIRVDRGGETVAATLPETAVTPELAELIDFAFEHGHR
jgi:hypothetical protein